MQCFCDTTCCCGFLFNNRENNWASRLHTKEWVSSTMLSPPHIFPPVPHLHSHRIIVIIMQHTTPHIYLISRVVRSVNGGAFYSTCLWNIPESFTRKFVHHVSVVDDEEDLFTASLKVRSRLFSAPASFSRLFSWQNLGNAVRWVIGRPPQMAEKVMIVISNDEVQQGTQMVLANRLYSSLRLWLYSTRGR